MSLILGLLASLLAPYFNRVRENAWQETLTADVRRAIVLSEEFLAREGRWPQDVEELESAGWTPSEDTRVCLYEAMPATRFRGEYFVIMTTHTDGQTVVWTAYPTMDGRVEAYRRDRQRGCEGISSSS